MKIKGFTLTELWFALALVLTTATQLRWGDLPVGPGELMLLIWLIIAGFHILKQRRILLTSSLKLFIVFWSLILILLFAGWLVGLIKGVFNFRAGIHNFLAYSLICVFALMAINYWDNKKFISIGKLVLLFAVVGLTPLWIYGQFFTEFGKLQIWYGGIRFLGWAVDPNQTAILLVPLPFIALYYFRQSSVFIHKLVLLALLVGATVLGISTESDSLKVAWAGAIVIYFIIAMVSRGKITYRKLVTVLAITILVFLAGIFVFGHDIYASVEEMYYFGNQGPDRIALWINGLHAVSSSPLVGFGPGAYSGVHEPFSGGECHNTFIDWMTNTGAVGFLLLFFLLTLVFVKAMSSKNEEVVAVLTSLVIVSMFLYVIRHPVWWFYILWSVSVTFKGKENKVSELT